MEKNTYTKEELFVMFQKEYPYLTPNNTNVGRYATRIGLVKLKQMHKGKVHFFYVRKEDLK